MSTIRSLCASNFKTFDDLTVTLDRFNVIVGANASGKSSFVQILRFLRDIAEYGLSNAVSRQGGIRYTRNLLVGQSRDTEVSVSFIDRRVGTIRRSTGDIKMSVEEGTYEFAIASKERSERLRVTKDQLRLSCSVSRQVRDRQASQATGTITFSNERGRIRFSSDLPDEFDLQVNDFVPPFIEKIGPDQLLGENRYSVIMYPPLYTLLTGVTAYDFDPRLARRSIQMTGNAELEDDGSNLAIVLRDIWQDAARRRKMTALLRDVLPAVSSWGIMTLEDTSLLLKMNETFAERTAVPASFLSDGTIHVVALLTALYFDTNESVVIEEPERNLHPSLLSRLVSLMRDASDRKQIIITTHSPEIVKHAGLDHLMLLQRDSSGFSRLSRPKDVPELSVFMENEIGVDQLYVDNLL